MAEQAQEKGLVTYEPNMPVKDAGTLKRLLERDSYKSAMMAILPKYLTPERVFMVVQMAMSRQPKLFDCTQSSLMAAIMIASEMGVSVSGQMARGFLVPYWNGKIKKYEAKFIVGYGGLIDIICSPGSRVSHLTAEVVYADDYFRAIQGSENRIEHEPNIKSAREDDAIIAAYTIGWIVNKNGQPVGQVPHVMTRGELLKHRDRTSSRDRNDEIIGPWVTDFKAMCKKTPVRGIANYLPLSKEQQAELSKYDDAEYSEQIGSPAVTLTPTDGRQSWGFNSQAAGDPPGDATIDQTADHAGPPNGDPVVTEEDISKAMNSIKKRLQARGKKTLGDVDAAVKQLCEKIGAERFDTSISVDQYNVALEWVDEL